MFFSIIIPTYNPRQFLPILLNSIIKNKCLDDIEIIISDDCSTESFEDVLGQYPQCHFRCITNDKHYGFSRIGRENGAQAARGKWICFADQDDYFINYCFDTIKDLIQQNDYHNYITTNAYRKTLDNEFIPVNNSWSLTHGKFYERSFWINYNIHYPEVKYCEDSNLQSMLECLIINNNLPIVNLPLFTYVWVARADSTSLGNGPIFFVKSFPDYLRGELITYVDAYVSQEDLTPEADQWYRDIIITQLIGVYFEFQMLYLKHINFSDFDSILRIIKPIIDKLLNKINLSYEELEREIEEEYMSPYNEIRASLFSYELFFIERQSLYDWLQSVKNV